MDVLFCLFKMGTFSMSEKEILEYRPKYHPPPQKENHKEIMLESQDNLNFTGSLPLALNQFHCRPLSSISRGVQIVNF